MFAGPWHMVGQLITKRQSLSRMHSVMVDQTIRARCVFVARVGDANSRAMVETDRFFTLTIYPANCPDIPCSCREVCIPSGSGTNAPAKGSLCPYFNSSMLSAALFPAFFFFLMGLTG